MTDRQTPSFKPILCLDFDGVIHSYTSGWQGAACIPDPPVPGALGFIQEAVAAFEVHVFSSRSHQPGGIEAMQAWLKIAFAQYFSCGDLHRPGAHWTQAEAAVVSIAFPSHKPSATVSLDDRGLTFRGSWPSIESLRTFQPWNKR